MWLQPLSVKSPPSVNISNHWEFIWKPLAYSYTLYTYLLDELAETMFSVVNDSTEQKMSLYLHDNTKYMNFGR